LRHNKVRHKLWPDAFLAVEGERRRLMFNPTLPDLRALRHYWSRTVTSMLQGQWQLIDTGFRVANKVLEAASNIPVNEGPPREAAGPAAPGASRTTEELVTVAMKRMKMGFAPAREIYEAPHRDRVDWSQFPDWARPVDPEVFEGCSHEG
jgi:hypothetical protein